MSKHVSVTRAEIMFALPCSQWSVIEGADHAHKVGGDKRCKSL